MTKKRREAALEENKQEGADDVQPKATINGEKADFKGGVKKVFLLFLSLCLQNEICSK